MRNDPVITLTTDFGHDDPFVGVMKGVILSIKPDATIVDLNHGIASHDISAAAYTVGMNYRFFPERTVHLVIVDPGVGSRRRPLLVITDRHYFIGPDNGVFSLVYAKEKIPPKVIHITADHYFLKLKSPTFQGRDVFAPVAAWIAAGKNLGNFGDPIADYEKIALPSPKVKKGVVLGEIIQIDKFGNCMANISQAEIDELRSQKPGSPINVSLGGKKVALREYYGQTKGSTLAALINSSEYLEFFLNRDSAARKARIRIGQKVELKLSS